MFIVVHIGKVKETTSSESFALSFATLIDTHIVALLEEVENATRISFSIGDKSNSKNYSHSNNLHCIEINK